jgi:RNAse (barnase) inhibitor barstar
LLSAAQAERLGGVESVLVNAPVAVARTVSSGGVYLQVTERLDELTDSQLLALRDYFTPALLDTKRRPVRKTDDLHVHYVLDLPDPGTTTWWFKIAEPIRAERLVKDMKATGLAAGLIRGESLRTREGVFTEFATAFGFPTYFGHNWDALGECLSDLSWLETERGIGIVIQSGEHAFGEDPSVLRHLVDVLHDAARSWAAPSEHGVSSTPVPLLVLIQFSEEAGYTALPRWRHQTAAELNPIIGGRWVGKDTQTHPLK